MSTHDQRETAMQITEERPVYATDAEWDWARLTGFTQAEWRRLVFLRWLYRQGRLTEFPPRGGAPEEAGPLRGGVTSAGPLG